MGVYLNSFYPLCYTKKGELAVKKYGIPPFIDGSCRREPDFQNTYPPITGICRLSKLLNRIVAGDLIIYITSKGYYGLNFKHLKLICILKVNDIKPDHVSAATYYSSLGLTMPSNLMLIGSHPEPIEKTHQRVPAILKSGGIPVLRKWDALYFDRARKEKRVAVCEVWNNQLFLNTPPIINEDMMFKIFGRIPMTMNPPILNNNEWNNFKTLLIK